MKEFYKILFISTNDCFFYLNDSNLRKIRKCNQMDSIAIEIEFGENFSQRMYSSLKKSHMKNIGDDEIGVNSHYASLQGLKENDLVVVSICVVPSLKAVYVRTDEELHLTLIKENFNQLQNNLLNQVNTIFKGQIIPIYICNNISVLLKIEKMDPFKPFGRLEKCSELVVLSPSDKYEIDKKFVNESENNNNNNNNNNSNNNSNNNCSNERNIFNERISKLVNWLSHEFNLSYGDVKGQKVSKKSIENGMLKSFFKKMDSYAIYLGLNRLAFGKNKMEQSMPEICQGSESIGIYRVRPLFSVENEIPDEVKDKFIFAWNFPNAKPIFGPCSFKIFCKISKIEENSDRKIVLKSKYVKESEDKHLFSYVIGSNEKETNHFSMDLYCPDFIMENLQLKVGSTVKIEEMKCTNEIIKCNDYSDKSSIPIRARKEEGIFCFPEETKKIYGSIIRTVMDNVKYKQRLNILIIGSPGCGKTFLLNALSDFFGKKFLYCSRIDCKTLWRMKMEKLNKLFNEKLADCCKLLPSIIFFDDLDSLFDEEDEGVPYTSIYSRRIGDLIISSISEIQKAHEVIVIAAANSMSKLGNISTARGPIIFECIHEINELSLKDRNSILRELIHKKKFQKDAFFIDEISEKTKGYNIQDLNDLMEVAALKYLARINSNVNENADIQKSDFEAALSEKTPLSLYGINLHKGISTWVDVGGMEEAKKALTEMFAWPLKYPEIFSSCPLRHQCGVLLYGAPGTGKTLIAGAVAQEFGMNFISIKGPEIFSKYVGASEEGIRNLFSRARQARPCILFFDEFDSIATRRGDDNTGVNDRVVNQMLTELDGFEELTGVFVLAATSRPDLLDPALLRPGRIDKAVYCALPEKTQRLKILEALSKRIILCDNVNLEEIARMSEGFTGADLQAVLYSAQTFLVKEMEKRENAKERRADIKLKQHHLLAGIAETKPSISDEDKLKYKKIYDGFSASKSGGLNKSERSANGQLKLTFA